MKRLGLGFATMAALALSPAGLSAQEPKATPPLIQETFEQNAGGWQGIGPNATVSVTRDPAHVKEGKGALQYDYKIAKGEFNLLLLPTPNNELAKMKSLRFWIKTDHIAAMVVTLQERGGGRYNAAFTSPAQQWQHVELTPADFVLAKGNEDPKDPNNQLDLDQVEAVALADIGQFFAQVDELARLFGVPTGSHRLQMDDFQIGAEALANASETVDGVWILDTFTRPQLGWLAIGSIALSKANGKPLDGPALQLDYRQAPGKIPVLFRPIPPGRLKGMNTLAFHAASAKPMTLIVQVEDPSGGKHQTTVELPGNSEKKEFRLNFAIFTPTPDNKSNKPAPDLDAVHQLLFLDAAGFTGAVDQDNTIWINGIKAIPAKSPSP
jgi:hypothetical protein